MCRVHDLVGSPGWVNFGHKLGHPFTSAIGGKADIGCPLSSPARSQDVGVWFREESRHRDRSNLACSPPDPIIAPIPPRKRDISLIQPRADLTWCSAGKNCSPTRTLDIADISPCSYGHCREGGKVGYGATPLPLSSGRWIATLVWNSLGSTWHGETKLPAIKCGPSFQDLGRFLSASPTSLGSFAESDLLRKFTALGSIFRCHHRIIVQQSPFLAIFFWGQIV